VPMALELGLGITPWSPLKSGLLSGKYTRANHGKLTADRAAFMSHLLNDKTYALVEELEQIARAKETTVARVALAWVQAQPGVGSTLIGARRIAQLEDNVKAANLALSKEELTKLDTLTKPTFGFPQSMQPMFPAIHNGGTNVNGVQMPPSAFVLQAGDKPY
jgi:aryl-alcohol dehydrogenase-like predicted oxidoreductase